MRKIKFRVWQKYWKQMFYNAQRAYDGLGYMQDANGKDIEYDWQSFQQILDSDELKVMQFTGLLDKNKKEIYEGDIVLREEHLYMKEAKIPVDFDNGIFYPFGQEAGLDSPQYAVDPKDCEVIGNIYENPELLKNG